MKYCQVNFRFCYNGQIIVKSYAPFHLKHVQMATADKSLIISYCIMYVVV